MRGSVQTKTANQCVAPTTLPTRTTVSSPKPTAYTATSRWLFEENVLGEVSRHLLVIKIIIIINVMLSVHYINYTATALPYP